ncbi:MAG: TSUP family transporter [Lysobacterales bacterium]
MTAYLVVALTAFTAAGLTLYSGFGLGTLLLPVFALFFPAEIAVVATALVHGANSVLKVSLLGRFADPGTVLKFGLPAIVAALFGALTLGWIAKLDSAITIAVNDQLFFRITPVKLVIGLLMIGFALIELLPRFRSMKFERRYLWLGGLLSGFFGGLSGHQGALRSAFLAKTGLSTERFVASNAVTGFLVDVTRISVYVALFTAAGGQVSEFDDWPLVLTGGVSAFCGVLMGKRFLHKVTMTVVQTLVGLLLFVVGLALVTGML